MDIFCSSREKKSLNEFYKQFSIETLTNKEINTQIIHEIADYYRKIFNNNGHYLVYPSNIEFISPQDIFKQNNVDLDTMDKFTDFPKHPTNNESSILWHDPETTFNNFQEKLSNTGVISIIRAHKTQEIHGLLFGYSANIKTIFEKEWENPFIYTKNHYDIKQCRSYNSFLEKMQKASNITEQNSLFCWSCVALSETINKNPTMLIKILYYFFQQVEQQNNDFIIAEAITESASFKTFVARGAKPISNILNVSENLKNGDNAIMLAPAKQFTQNMQKTFLARYKK